MSRRTLVLALVVLAVTGLGLTAYFAFQAGLVLTLLLMLAAVLVAGVAAMVVGVLTKSEPLTSKEHKP